MDGSYRFFIVFIDILIPFCLGLWLRKKQISPEIIRYVIKTNVIPVTTALSLISFWMVSLTPVLLWLPFSVAFMCFIPAGVFFLFEKRRFSDPREQGSYLAAMMMGNIGTLAGLCAYILYGETGFAYVQLIGMPQVLVLVHFCFPAAQYYYALWKNQGSAARPHFRVREMLLTWNQLPAAGVAAGLLLSYAGVPHPAAVGTIFGALIHVSAWMGMIPVGYGTDIKGAFRYWKRLWMLIPVKFMLVPAVLYGMTRYLTDDQTVLVCVLLSAAAPTAIFSVMTSQLYDLSVDLAESSFIMTTLLFLLIIYPAVYWYIGSGGTL
jgi:predicted permease